MLKCENFKKSNYSKINLLKPWLRLKSNTLVQDLKITKFTLKIKFSKTFKHKTTIKTIGNTILQITSPHLTKVKVFSLSKMNKSLPGLDFRRFQFMKKAVKTSKIMKK